MIQQTYDDMHDEVVQLRRQAISQERRQLTAQRAQHDHVRQHSATRSRELDHKIANVPNQAR